MFAFHTSSLLLGHLIGT